MRIALHGVGVGIREDDGAWVEKRGGVWTEIPPPSWAPKPAGKPAKPAPATAAALTMADPHPRPGDDVAMVTVVRTVRRTVPDYEAEVLLRNGWTLDTG